MVFEGEHDFRTQHIALYCFLLQQNNRNHWTKWFKCPFDLAIQGAGIGSKETYYKALDFLQNVGLLEYEKGINMWKAPRVCLKVLEVENQTATLPQCEPQPEPQATLLGEPQPEQLTELLLGSLQVIDKDYKRIDNILIDLRRIIAALENIRVNDEGNEKPVSDKLKVVNDLMAYFNFTEIGNPDKMLEAGRFVNLLTNQGRIDQFEKQFAAYQTYKSQSKEIPHGWRGFLGSIEKNFNDGGWNAENWVAKAADSKPEAETTADDKKSKLESYLS